MQDRPNRPPWWAVTAATAALLAFLLATHLMGGAGAAVISDLAQFLAAGAAAATTAAHGRRCEPGRLRAAWLLLAASCASWCAGQGYWAGLRTRPVPRPLAG
jgi:peptidoglycan/LPS O-acetylase OafA/YrhL